MGLAVAMLAEVLVASPSGATTDVLSLFGNGGFEEHAWSFARQAEADGKTTRRMELGDTYSSKLYVDLLRGGTDATAELGLETANFAFHIGHGHFWGWHAYANAQVHLGDVQFGDAMNGTDGLRYLWLVSCHVMAHGPPPFDRPYAGTLPAGSKNVFGRWGSRYTRDGSTTTPLGESFRLACGGSTKLEIPSLDDIVSLWAELSAGGAPSDTFLNGFATPSQVPLCIARGGADPSTSPLFDTSIETAANPHGDGTHLYIQYPVLVEHTEPKSMEWVANLLVNNGAFDVSEIAEEVERDPPQAAPILRLQPLPISRLLNERFLDDDAAASMSFRRLSLDRVQEVLRPLTYLGALEGPAVASSLLQAMSVSYDPCSGARTLRAPRPAPLRISVQDPTEVELPLVAAPFSQLLDAPPGDFWGPPRPKRVPTSPRRYDMYIDGVPQSWAGAPSAGRVDRYLKHHRIEVGSAIAMLDDSRRPYPVFGGGNASVEIGPDGSAPTISTEARRIVGCREPDCRDEPLRSIEEAEKEAKAEAASLAGVSLSALQTYFHPPRRTWGYFEAPATCYQPEMGIVYRFVFEPLPYTYRSTLIVEIPAHTVEPWVCVGSGDEGEAILPPRCSAGNP